MKDLDIRLPLDELNENRSLLNLQVKPISFCTQGKEKKLEPWTLSMRDVLDYVPVCKETIYGWIKIGYFPEKIGSVSRGKHIWRMNEVIGFLDKCIANENSYDDHIKSRMGEE